VASAPKILVVNGSFSMGYKPGEKSRFDLAKRYARDIVARSSQGDGFSLVLMSDPCRVIVGSPAFVSDDARAALKLLASASTGDPEKDPISSTEQMPIP